MLAMTENAIDAIKLVAPGEAGLRIFTADPGSDDLDIALGVEVTEQPADGDAVVDVRGAHLFLEPAAATRIDDKVLDASLDGTSVRFAIADQP
jgi:iron-sulfur cluster assembly protein